MEVAEGIKTEFRFEELSDSAKTKVRENYDHWIYPDQWWDSTFEDFIRVVEVFGFEVTMDDIYFSGFWSQGDGASFRGGYSSPLGSVHEALTRGGYGGKELLRLADELDVFMAPLRLLHYNAYWSARVYTSGHYSHSGTMRIEEITRHDDTPNDDIPEDELDTAEKAILGVARGLADWLYGDLEKEHEYLESDEALTGTFQDYKFDESGRML